MRSGKRKAKQGRAGEGKEENALKRVHILAKRAEFMDLRKRSRHRITTDGRCKEKNSSKTATSVTQTEGETLTCLPNVARNGVEDGLGGGASSQNAQRKEMREPEKALASQGKRSDAMKLGALLWEENAGSARGRCKVRMTGERGKNTENGWGGVYCVAGGGGAINYFGPTEESKDGTSSNQKSPRQSPEGIPSKTGEDRKGTE